jgi:hypothetical protein
MQITWKWKTSRRGNKVLDAYLGDVQIEYEQKPGYAEVLIVFFSLPKAIAGIISRLGHDIFLTNCLQFIIYEPPNHSTIYTLAADIAVK